MGEDTIRHLLRKPRADGTVAYYWNPSKTLRALHATPEALGTDYGRAAVRAIALNSWADAMRRGVKDALPGAPPGTLSCLFKDYLASDEFGERKARTQKDYRYYLGKIELEFGEIRVDSITAKVVKEYYRRLVRERSVTWAYHMIGTLRAVLSWAVTENWITVNPALDVTIKSPRKRTVVWEPEQAALYIAKAAEMGWHSVAVMAQVFDCIGQSPIDVRMLKRGAYDGRCVAVRREKTGITDAPIPLWDAAREALDGYLAARPAMLPEAPIFVNDAIGGQWVESTLAKVHGEIRTAAGLPKHLQLQDFRRTAQTEAGAAGGTADEIRGLARHATRAAGEHYVHPDARYVESVQAKRLAFRNRTGAKVRTPEG